MLLSTACSVETTGSSESVDTASDDVRVCAEGTTVRGVDVSFYQGQVNWQSVKNSGVGFGIARVSDGTTYVDDQFTRNWSEMKRVGLIRGAYQYFRPGQSANAQADLMINAVGALGDGDLPAVIDVETADGYSSSTIVSKVQAWLDRVEAATGKRPLIYAASGFWDTLSGTSQFADYDLWVANYGVSCPSMPNTWGNWVFWQYTDSGSTPGIPGGVDTNVFNGSLQELTSYASGGSVAVPPQLAIEVYWARQADGSYALRALAPAEITRVEYVVDGYPIGAATRADGSNFPTSYQFSLEKNERLFEVKGYDSSGQQKGHGIGLMDVTAGVGVYIKQMGAALYEIGLERAPSGVASIEVRADGYLLKDSVSGAARSSRLAVRSKFTLLGKRNFELSTYNADGSLRGTLRRSLTLE
ncbi:MAG: glycoside hydrolase family 25 protein [Polyangiaceae bacterium]